MIDAFELEVTARCNLDCRHCAIALPEADRAAKKRELGVGEIDRIAAEAAALGAGRCLITGGEPFLRKDFRELYQAVLEQGPARLPGHQRDPRHRRRRPLSQEVPAARRRSDRLGLTRETYERVTRRSGSFAAFKSGLDRLLRGAASPSVSRPWPCARTSTSSRPSGISAAPGPKRPYRIDPHLHLRFDRDESRNILIQAERLSPREIVRLERSGPERRGPSRRPAARSSRRPPAGPRGTLPAHLPVRRRPEELRHRAGRASAPLHVPPPPRSPLRSAARRIVRSLDTFRPVGGRHGSPSGRWPDKCGICPIVNLCLWCPGPRLSGDGGARLARRGVLPGRRARAEGLKSG